METIIKLFAILAIDVINPALFAATIYTLGAKHPYRDTTIMLFGYFIIYLIVGFLIAVGFAELIEFITKEPTINYVIELIAGILLLWFAWKLLRTDDIEHDPEIEKPAVLGDWTSFILGCQVNFIGLPFAIPYLAAIDTVLLADITLATTVCLITIYNILYIVPFASMMFIRKIYEQDSQKIFHTINHYLNKVIDIVLPFFLIVFGIYFLWESLTFFLVPGVPH